MGQKFSQSVIFKLRNVFQNMKTGSWASCAGYAISFSGVFVLVGLLASLTIEKKDSIEKSVQELKLVWAKLLLQKYSRSAALPVASSDVLPLMRKDVVRFFDQSLEPVPQPPLISERERLLLVPHSDLLSDPLERIGDEFKIDPRLRARTEFWFKVYTQFDSHDHVIHHIRYPWIIFKVVNTKEMIDKGNGPLWMRRQKAQNFVKSEQLRIAKVLRKLSQSKRAYNKLSAEEKEFITLIKTIKSRSLSKELLFASQNIRSQLGQKEFFIAGLRNSGKYLPYMEEEFLRLGLPVELTRLPFVESSFNEKAKSKVGASGIWQIMPRTGKAFLIVNDHIDERNSPLKATRAAGRLLKSYYRSLSNKWPLAITSYNHGIGNIKKSMQKANSNDIATIIERYHGGSFKFASSNFYSCFLAALFAERYHDILFPYIAKHRLLEREVVKLDRQVNINYLPKLTHLSLDTLRFYNRDLEDAIRKNRGTLPKGFELHIPLSILTEEAYRAADRGSETKLATPGSEKIKSL